MNLGKMAIYGFALIFVAVGLALLYEAILTLEEGVTANALMMLVAALAFGGSGSAVAILAARGQRSQAHIATLTAARPDEPWMWRDDWAIGQVRSSGKGTVWALWGFALFWNLLSTPLVFFLPEEILEKGNSAALLGLLFPLVGVGLIAFAVRRTIQRRKYGESTFVMEQVPGVLGGEVAGTIMVERGLTAGETLTVRLSCIHRQRQRTGKGTSTHEYVLWQTEGAVVRLMPAGGESSQAAAVKFRVPYDARATSEIDRNNSILWKLEANAAVPGVDFAADFEIPVFKTPASSPQVTEEQLRSVEVAAAAWSPSSSDDAGVRVVQNAEGGKEFILKPYGGVPGAVPSLSVIVLFWGITAFLAYVGAPVIVLLLFGIFGLLFAFSLVFGAFGESRIVVEDGHVSVRNTLFGIMMGRRARCENITKVSVKGEARTGERGHYAVTLTQVNGKPLSPLQFLRERRHAEWLAEEVRKAMAPWRSEQHSRESVERWPT